VGIVAGTTDLTGLDVFPFRTDRFVLAVSKQHPLAKVQQISFGEVLDEDFVGLDRASALQRFLDNKAERLAQRLKLRVQLRSFDAVCRLTEYNVGIGVVPQSTAARNAKTMAIHTVQLTDDWAVRELMICVPQRRAIPSYVRELVDYLRVDS
jgi:DNA-binding transcriptional LysR family regulator